MEARSAIQQLANGYGLPAVITENGTQPTDDSGETFLRPHLDALLGAMASGADVRGYFYWSLMDNYEWNHGLNEFKMGMFAVDPKTKTPLVSPLATGYGAIAVDNGF